MTTTLPPHFHSPDRNTNMVPRVASIARPIFAFLSLLFCFAVAAHAVGIQATFYVAPGGNDENSGTIEKPFRTLDRARQAVREINAQMMGDIVVVLFGGTYAIQRTLVFDAADSGTGGHNVIYRAASKQHPIISGGRRITDWRPDVGNRWKAKTDLEDFRQLYVGGIRAIRPKRQARWVHERRLLGDIAQSVA